MKVLALLYLLALWLAPLVTEAAPAAPATSAPACDMVTPLPQAAETFTVGTLRVQRYGDQGRPVILIPGLASGSWAWQGSIDRLAPEHRLYVLTLAGFDGTAP
ncbi:MAG: alpha/beta hydrolase, partial [Gammaproteobacteria bacterium]|nr:alpha/beta hydrolase [Gammaproteobacteria bacterium]